MAVRRDLTAISRRRLSMPAAQAHDLGVLQGELLDYGCDRGDDVTALATAGYGVQGWDPHFRPGPAPAPADTVLLTYVLNAIEDAAERAQTLRQAWALSRRALVVTVRTQAERNKVTGVPFADGLLTQRSTFQRLFEPAELRQLVDQELTAHTIPIRPGQLVAYRERSHALEHLADRYGSRDAVIRAGDVLDAAGTVDLAGQWLQRHGRLPIETEDPAWTMAAVDCFGGVRGARTAAERLVPSDRLTAARQRLRDNTTLLLALDTFHGRTSTAALPRTLVADALATFQSVRAARTRSDELLRFLASPEWLSRAIRASRFGKLTPTALYVHAEFLDRLSLPLRLYAACGSLVAGYPDFTTLLKLHHGTPAVSFLGYPEFSSDPHPRIAESLTVDLRRQTASHTDYTQRSNRPLLHRKHEFLPLEHPDRKKYERLTRQEVTAGLYLHPERIGLEQGWEAELQRCGVQLRGHRLLRCPGGT